MDQTAILGQLTSYWNQQLWPGLAALTDDEYLWEPTSDCWTIRPTSSGAHTVDWSLPAPEPPPLTTIAWHIAYVVINLSTRAHRHFNAAPFAPETYDWPGTAAGGLDLLLKTVTAWCRHLQHLDPARLAAPAGAAEGIHHEHSTTAMLLNANCQVIHHGAAILLQRRIRSHSIARECLG